MSAPISPDASLSLGYLPTRRPLLYSSVASLPDFETNRHQWNECRQIFFTYKQAKLKRLIKNLWKSFDKVSGLPTISYQGGALAPPLWLFPLTNKFSIPPFYCKEIKIPFFSCIFFPIPLNFIQYERSLTITKAEKILRLFFLGVVYDLFLADQMHFQLLFAKRTSFQALRVEYANPFLAYSRLYLGIWIFLQNHVLYLE